MRKSWGVLPIFFIFTLLLMSLPLQAAQTGKIAGVITDAETGEALPGASVQIDGTMMGAATDQNGQYFILNVPPGTYTCNVMFMGYTTQKINSVKVQIDATARLDAKLSATVIEGESVSVIAERPIIDKAMTATKISFSDDALDNVLPAGSLNDILQTSVTTQSMRGANKVGVAYMVDGVDVSDIMFKTGGTSDGYTGVKRGGMASNNSSGTFEGETGNYTNTHSAGMVETVGKISQSGVQEAEVIAGTFNAEYSASGGIVNIASKSGGRALTGKVNFRSSLGGLDHMGPDMYDNSMERASGMSLAEVYYEQRDALLADPSAEKVALGQTMTWDGPVDYGEAPRMNGDITVGGPLTDKGAFFFTGSLLNDHGRLPGEFQRDVGLSLKMNYNVSDNDKLTVYGKVDDGGVLGGWNNRTFTYYYGLDMNQQMLNQSLGLMGYLKWNHVFDASSYLDVTVSYVGQERFFGFKPNADKKLIYDDYGDDWLILDTAEKANYYMNDPETRIFTPTPGNFASNDITKVGSSSRYGIAGYQYENMNTSTLAGALNYTRQIDFHNQLKAGVEFKYNTIDLYQQMSRIGHPDPIFDFEFYDYTVNPMAFGAFLQDKIEYEGIIVNLGIRFDGYNTDTEAIDNLWRPTEQVIDPETGQMVLGWVTSDDTKSELRTYFSPRIGVSHPITETAAMHYSWGIYTTQPNYATSMFGYGVLANVSLPHVNDPDPEPEVATAYEIGVNLALSDDFGADMTAYYRDTRNAARLGFNITPNTAFSGGCKLYSYGTNWGYRDSRGLELTVWKRPQREMYWDIVGVSGNVSVSYSYDKTGSSGQGIQNDPAFQSTIDESMSDYDFDLAYIWPTISRGFSDWNSKATILFDFPMQFKFSNFLSYRSPWRYRDEGTDTRYFKMLNGDDFFQWDLRLTKYITLGKKYRMALFVEALNVLNTENVVSYDTYPNASAGRIRYRDTDGDPYGLMNRPVDPMGNLYTGIARELYAGFEIAFE